MISDAMDAWLLGVRKPYKSKIFRQDALDIYTALSSGYRGLLLLHRTLGSRAVMLFTKGKLTDRLDK